MKKTQTKLNKKISRKSTRKKDDKKIKARLTDLEQKNLRLLADYENLKKRKNEEIVGLLKYSGENLIKQLIPIFDDLDRIISESDKENKKNALYEGIEILSNKLYKVLLDNNIQKFDSVGEIFDSNLHDALMMKNSKKNKDVIVEEFEKGYKYHDKIIKHSKVVVSKGKK
ncbi:MAG: nucleotide exchange factor GrpE [Candidatus Marinimicrobia bacterium]|nr:nucleotide exchange factor GrpE [Candidatus Neomarinimicrobiota bacterium]|tara:strand:- start:283 stop:792 length:510 start_codon:yes stop_codon:yes gene_type:complete